MAKPGELAGRTLAGRYEVLDQIGSGGMGEVYRARDRELDDLIALKIVRGDLLAFPDMLERFRREVKLARRVTHANVARAFELVIADGVTAYTMELVEGVSLARRLASGRLAVGEAAAILVALCDAPAAAHDAGIVHRDVKPANVLLGDDGRIVLTDFGIAALSREELDLGGTPRFMAPEQACGHAATPAADDAMARLADAFATGPLPTLRWGIALAHALDGCWDEVDRARAELEGSGSTAAAATACGSRRGGAIETPSSPRMRRSRSSAGS